jgi:hypothetical protein
MPTALRGHVFCQQSLDGREDMLTRRRVSMAPGVLVPVLLLPAECWWVSAVCCVIGVVRTIMDYILCWPVYFPAPALPGKSDHE